MNRIKYAYSDPYPLPPSLQQNFEIETEDEIQLPITDIHISPPFDDVLDQRLSARNLTPPKLHEVSALLKLSLNIRGQSNNDYGPIQSRSCPASGGLHAYDLALIGDLFSNRAVIYSPANHTIAYIKSISDQDTHNFRSKLQELFPNSNGIAMIFLANSLRYKSKYANWESLALRDSGALFAIMNLCAQRIGIGFCIAGMLGSELSELPPLRNTCRMGMGVAITGALSY